jgi:hypothetical protein
LIASSFLKQTRGSHVAVKTSVVPVRGERNSTLHSSCFGTDVRVQANTKNPHVYFSVELAVKLILSKMDRKYPKR